MSTYGLVIKDETDTNVIDAKIGTVVSAGRLTMPSGLNGDNTYGTDIALPMSNVPLANIVVIANPVLYDSQKVFQRWTSGGTLLENTHYANSAKTYYTRNTGTGVLSTWTAGNKTASSKTTWNPMLSTFPVAQWDRMGATTFNNVRLFAAMAYCVRAVAANDTNLSLDGTASNSGGWAYDYPGGGTADNINDGVAHTYNPGAPTGSGWGSGVTTNYPSYPWTEDDSSSVETVTLASASTITMISINWMFDTYPGTSGGNASVTFTVALEIDSAWHDIFTTGTSGDTWGATDSVMSGFWRRVTAIRVTQSEHVQTGSSSNELTNSQLSMGEIRAWGGSYTDSTENKLVYTIGSNGVSAIDYLVAIKKYNP